MTSILGILAVLAFAGPTQVQSVDDLSIVVQGFQTATQGAEKPAGVRRGTGPLRIGQPTLGVFWMSGCGAFSVSSVEAPFGEGAQSGWRVEVTPTRIVDYAVTFRLRWTRALDTGRAFGSVGEDVEVTLKPGESRLIDSVPVVQPSTAGGPPCRMKSAGLRVSAEFYSFDRRLIDADVWLVEKLPNGKEDSQLQSLRGTPHREMRFYFDTIAAGKDRVDVFGHLIAYLEHGDEILVNVEVVRARADPGQSGYQSANWFRSSLRLRVKPNASEIVEVALPPRDNESAYLANRTFALRIRPRQAR